MNINFTVIVQICNFLFLYKALQKIVLEKVFSNFIAKTNEIKHIQLLIEKKQQEVVLQKQKHLEEWALFQRYCIAHQPEHNTIKKDCCVYTKPSAIYEVNEQNIQEVSSQYTILIEKLMKEHI